MKSQAYQYGDLGDLPVGDQRLIEVSDRGLAARRVEERTGSTDVQAE